MDGTRGPNEVRLEGRVSAAPEERMLPSGDRVVLFRVIVDRAGPAAARQQVDALECVSWSARVSRAARTWQPGDRVQVEGSLRRRFFRAGGVTQSRVEVEVSAGRVIRRAASA